MILPDRMFCSAWIRDLRLRRLPAHVQLLLIFLRPLCDKNGRFEFNPALIHMALYVSAECGNVSVRDVEAWLEILRSGGFIKSYTEAGTSRRVGEIAKEYWRQRLAHGKGHFEAEGDEPELPLDAAPPEKEISKAGRGSKKAPPLTSLHFDSPARASDPAPPPPAPLSESDDAWLARVRAKWPHIDVDAELLKAHRKRKGDVERVWFESVWLPGVSPKAPLPTSSAPVVAIEPEPEAWRLHLKDHHEGESWAESAAATEWGKLPQQWRETIAREMRANKTHRAVA